MPTEQRPRGTDTKKQNKILEISENYHNYSWRGPENRPRGTDTKKQNKNLEFS